jgi:hypothetical protein
MNTPYNDDYQTCEETYSTLRIYSRSLDVPKKLNLKPSDISEYEDLNGYFYSTKNVINSKDLRRHLDYLIEMFKNKVEVLNEIQAEGNRIDLVCYWVSQNGHGGPTLSPKQLNEIAKLNVEIWFDIYGL